MGRNNEGDSRKLIILIQLAHFINFIMR
jgi:hypothetical protein